MTEPLATFRPGEIVRIRGERWIVERHLPYGSAAILEVRGSDRTNGTLRTRFVTPVEPVDLLPSSRVPRVVRPPMWRRVARQALAEGLSRDDALRTIAAADARLLPFQFEPALAVLRGLGSRVLIADEVGLGKTVQAGLLVAELLARLPDAHALIVAPAGLRDQWRTELEARFGLYAAAIDSAALARFGTGAVPGANPWQSSAVVIASIDYIKRPEVLRSFETAIWDAVVFDEAHALSGRSDRAEAAAVLADRARIVVMLSATPHSGDDAAFARLCNLGHFKQGPRLVVFRRTRHDVGITASRQTTWLRVRPTSEETELHVVLMDYTRRVWKQAGASQSGAQLAMIVLVRRACSSPTSLARSIARRLASLEASEVNRAEGAPTVLQPLLPLGEAVDDEEPAALLMGAGLDDVVEERRCLLRILQLAHAASSRESKLNALLRLFRRTREPVIVFTEYRDTLARVASSLADLTVVILHGGLTPTERAESLDRFTRGDARVLVATDAASEGLNLQRRCRFVVNLELPWSPLRLEQRIGRVDRLGQQHRVHAMHFIAAGTSEENTVARLFSRLARMESTTADLRRPALDESDIARSVFGDQGSGVRDQDGFLAPDPVLPRNVTVPDLRSVARGEAERAATARLLGAGPSNAAALERPVMTRIRRRLRSPHCYWAFRLGYDDEDGFEQWHVLLGVKQSVARVMSGTRAGIRDLVEQHTAEARATATTAQHRMLTGIRARHSPSIELATGRELAILDAIGRHHARLAARLLQPGLFDHRTERAASAQSAARDEVLAYGAARLRELDRRAKVIVGACDLLFAVIVG